MSAAPVRSTGGTAEERLLSAAARRIAVQLAAGTLLLLVAVGSGVFALDRSAARRAAEDTLERAAASAEDVRDPPAGVFLVLRTRSGRITATPGTPAAAASGALLQRPSGFSDVSTAGRHYRVFTASRADGLLVQALLDLHAAERERDRLLAALLVAGGLAVPGAAGVGLLLARRAIRPLGDALALQRRFVADASHELRAPLTLLHTRAQLLSRSAAAGRTDRAGIAEQLELLVRDTRTMGEVVEDLLLSAELKHRPAARQPVDLVELAREVAASFAPAATENGVQVELRTDAPAVVLGSRPALRRAVSALLDNALGHVRPGDRVSVQVEAARDAARLSVTDTGVGLDPARADALLARFARGEQAPGPGRRFGLGLALVREVLHAHGGQLLVDGAPGEGAAFTVVLPLAPAPAPESWSDHSSSP